MKARANNRLNPTQAMRRHEELARVPELLLSVAYCILIPSVLLGPCAVIWITNADPLQAAPLTFAVRCNPLPVSCLQSKSGVTLDWFPLQCGRASLSRLRRHVT